MRTTLMIDTQTRTFSATKIGLYALLIMPVALAAFGYVALSQGAKTVPVSVAFKGQSGRTASLSANSLQATGQVKKKQLNQALTDSARVTFTPPASKGVAVSGQATLNSTDSYARVIAVQSDGTELLVANLAYPDSQGIVAFSDLCEETCAQETQTPQVLKVELNDATLTLADVTYIPSDGKLKAAPADINKELKAAQLVSRIALINEKNTETKQYWSAGETDVAKLSYAEKKKLFGGKLPARADLFLTYKSGYFPMGEDIVAPIESAAETVATKVPASVIESTDQEPDSPVPDEPETTEPFAFDWRDRHGQNWMTPAKDQQGCWIVDHLDYTLNYSDCVAQGYEWRSCGSCVTMASIGVIESLVNITYNTHINVELSAQDAIDCGPGGCSGSYPGSVLDYAQNTGIVDEQCYPYRAQEDSCSNICIDASTRKWKVGESALLPDFLSVKQAVTSAPIHATYDRWNHSFVLTGFGEILPGCYSTSLSGGCDISVPAGDSLVGTTYWVMKNSYGLSWGEEGYAKLIINVEDFITLQTTDITLPTSQTITPLCTDADNDGFCIWGSAAQQPSICPLSCAGNTMVDCNDADPSVLACPEHLVCGTKPWLPSGEFTPLGDYSYQSQEKCCGDNVGENSLGNICCDNTTDRADTIETYKFASRFGPGYVAGPVGMAVLDDKLFVADYYNNRIQIFTIQNGTATYFGSYGSYGTGNGKFYYPMGLSINDGKLIVTEWGNSRIQAFRINADYSLTYLTKFGMQGSGNGQFSAPNDVDSIGQYIYVADSGNNRIQVLEYHPDNTITFVNTTHSGLFSFPRGLTIDGDTVYVADSNNNRVRVLHRNPDQTLIPIEQFGSTGDGLGQFRGVYDVIISGENIITIENQRAQIFRREGKYYASKAVIGSSQYMHGSLKAAFVDGDLYVSNWQDYDQHISRFSPLQAEYCRSSCADGTLAGACSVTQPKYCLYGTLDHNCQLCGCPDETWTCQGDGTCLPQQCSDGTIYNQCSSSKPLYCQSGQLTSNCQACGCPPNSYCISDGTCKRGKPLPTSQSQGDGETQ